MAVAVDIRNDPLESPLRGHPDPKIAKPRLPLALRAKAIQEAPQAQDQALLIPAPLTSEVLKPLITKLRPLVGLTSAGPNGRPSPSLMVSTAGQGVPTKVIPLIQRAPQQANATVAYEPATAAPSPSRRFPLRRPSIEILHRVKRQDAPDVARQVKRQRRVANVVLA